MNSEEQFVEELINQYRICCNQTPVVYNISMKENARKYYNSIYPEEEYMKSTDFFILHFLSYKLKLLLFI